MRAARGSTSFTLHARSPYAYGSMRRQTHISLVHVDRTAQMRLFLFLRLVANDAGR